MMMGQSMNLAANKIVDLLTMVGSVQIMGLFLLQIVQQSVAMELE